MVSLRGPSGRLGGRAAPLGGTGQALPFGAVPFAFQLRDKVTVRYEALHYLKFEGDGDLTAVEQNSYVGKSRSYDTLSISPLGPLRRLFGGIAHSLKPVSLGRG